MASSIIDNQGENTLKAAIQNITANGRELCIATAFFSLDALALVGKNLGDCERVRILYGDEANATQRVKLQARIQANSYSALAAERLNDPRLESLRAVERLFAEGRIEARCYTAKKFHAKAYMTHLASPQGPHSAYGILGSGNFSTPGLTRNLELNVHLSPEQTGHLIEWFEERWAEAVNDDITEFVQAEIRRQIDLYDPYAIYQRALLLWGDWVQGRDPLRQIGILDVLDPHQEDAYRQALKIIARERGVLVCDGVGLGKSFVALALMEDFLARGKRVFLIAPKAIIRSSWEGYIARYLDRFRRGYSSLAFEPMTWFGYDPTRDDPATRSKAAELAEYARQAELVVIDESHNFRKTDANRYVNVLKMLEPGPLGRKTVVLLTATPINTEYQDLAAQFRLITQEHGHIGGFRIDQYQRAAVALDKDHKDRNTSQLELEPEADLALQGPLKTGLQTIAIQRSRSTCKRIAAAKGKDLRFPEREPIRTVKYDLSAPYRDLVDHAKREFEELAKFLRAYQAEVVRVSRKEEGDKRIQLRLPTQGLRFSAYLPDRYRRAPGESQREAQVESFLVSLVFVNVMKQLESSPVAFQGIVQALGAGLCARLTYMARAGGLEQTQVSEAVREHAAWIGRKLDDLGDEGEDEDDAVAADVSGDEMDEWLERALRVNSVRKGLAGFTSETHDVAKWRKHIEGDLAILRGIHERIVQARASSPDHKLKAVVGELRAQRERGRKVLVFTQSLRTAEYLEESLRKEFGDEVARMDSSIQGERRARILHAFSPRYNPMDPEPLDFAPVNILVSTDVLSEGVNLQEAGCILNYDIHWNPVRLIQRIGRVDRRLQEGDAGHTFAILNVEPPPEIEGIIELVGTVENRKRKIISMLGLDQSFFRADDPAGTLEEFNARLDGEETARDAALTAYDALVARNPADVAVAEAVPQGAYGVWDHAPVDGLFAAFTMKADPEKTSDADRERFRAVIDMPVLVLEADGKLVMDPTEVLTILAKTVRGQRSGEPGDPGAARAGLRRLREAARQSYGEMGLPKDIKPELVCWMELRTRRSS